MRSSNTYLLLAVSVLGTLLLPVQARGELEWAQLNLTGALGYSTFDNSYELADGLATEARVGLIFFQRLGIEGSYGKTYGNSDRVPKRNFPIDHYCLDLVWTVLPDATVKPFLLAGWTQHDLDEPQGVKLEMNGWEFGGGARINLLHRIEYGADLRLGIRNVMTKNDAPLPGAGDTKNSVYLTAEIQISLPDSDRDSDGDGIRDGLDRCADTRLGVAVDARGCPLDGDGDGVPDGVDRCQATPSGALVDASGCPQDSDGDGVLDGLDRCPGTRPGSAVNASGCVEDMDNDGVSDNLDRCPDTPRGARVNASGCPLDSDGDGVPDGLDGCEGTPFGVEVDASGCPVPTNEQEKQLLERGVLTLKGVRFDSGSSRLKPESQARLNEAGAVLEKFPSFRYEIGGHTDSSGSDEANLELSEARARVVLDYLIANFHSLRSERFSIRGYGATKPISTNQTAAGRAQNRRIEIRVVAR